MSDLVCTPKPKPSSNIDDVINDVIFSDGPKLTKTKSNETKTIAENNENVNDK